jgi:hypothetical protein
MQAMNIEQNQDTWQQVREFIAEYPDNEYWNNWRNAILPTLNRATDLGVDAYFRAGMAMHHLIFSTLDHHGLRGEPRVTIEVTNERELKFFYSTQNVEFNPPIEYEAVDRSQSADAFKAFMKYLRRLWKETMQESMPDVLNEPV